MFSADQLIFQTPCRYELEAMVNQECLLYILPCPSTALKLNINPVAMVVIYLETAYVPLEIVLTFFVTF